MILGIFIALPQLRAQTPGYLGKKFSFGYRTYVGLGLGQNGNYQKKKAENLYLRARHHLELDFVTSRRTSIGLDGGVYRNGMGANDPRSGDFNHIQLSGWASGAHLRFYPFLRKGNIAPLGPFTEIRLSYLRYNLVSPDSASLVNGDPNLGAVSNMAFSLTWGRNYLIKDKLLLSYGLQSGLLFRLPSEVIMAQDAQRRMWSSWGINFHFGVGGLLF